MNGNRFVARHVGPWVWSIVDQGVETHQRVAVLDWRNDDASCDPEHLEALAQNIANALNALGGGAYFVGPTLQALIDDAKQHGEG